MRLLKLLLVMLVCAAGPACERLTDLSMPSNELT